MPTQNKRRAAVQRLIEERFGGRVADFARGIERSPAQVWQFMNDRNIGERLARYIENKLGLRPGEIDGEDKLPSGFTNDELELLQNYRRSKASWRLMLQRLASVNASHQDKGLFDALIVLITKLGVEAGPHKTVPTSRSPRARRPSKSKLK